MPIANVSSFIRSKIESEGFVSIKEFLKYVAESQSKGILLHNEKHNSTYKLHIFTEIIAEWCLKFWQANNSPTNLKIIIFGSNNIFLIPKIIAYLNNKKIKTQSKFYIIEPNPFLREYCKKNIKNYSSKIRLVTNFEKITIDAFSIIIANKFFSSLPIDQYIHKEGNWFKTTINLTEDKQHFFTSHLSISNKNMTQFLNQKYPNAHYGSIVEIHDNTIIQLKKIVSSIKKLGGGILITDYGYIENNTRPLISTLQAKIKDQWCSLLDNLDKSSIRSQLNFSELKETIEIYGGYTQDPITQKDFLLNMEIEKKKNELLDSLPKNEHQNLTSEYKKLTDKAQISHLLKAMMICNRADISIGF